MLETIQEIINSPHTDWTTVIIMLSIIGLVVFSIVFAVIYHIVAKIKGWELPEAKIKKQDDEWWEDMLKRHEEESSTFNPSHPFYDEDTASHSR